MTSSPFFTVIVVLAAWFILNRWILPWFGVPTCMNGSCCSMPPQMTESQRVDVSKESVPFLKPENRDSDQ